MVRDTIPGNEAGNQGYSKLPYATLPKAGKASLVILPFAVEPGDRLILVCRVSSHTQGKNGNLDAQEVNLRRAVREKGGEVISIVRHVGSGYSFGWLKEAVIYAKEHNATILAATTDRFVRSSLYKSTHKHLWKAQASEQELYSLEKATEGVKLMTLLHPDASPGECRALLTRWGRNVRTEKVPGYKKQRKKELLAWVLELNGKGKTFEEISVITGVPRATVYRWVKGVER